MQKLLLALGGLLIALLLYLTLWPVPIDPVAWQAPNHPGYSGDFAPNTKLAGIRIIPLPGHHGPEDVALDERGRIYTGTEEGDILRLEADGTDPQVWAQTGGRPLGLDFDRNGDLIVADAYRGLLRVSPGREPGAAPTIVVLVDEHDGVPIRFADDLDIARNGKIYFSDASTKFGAREYGGPGPSSRLEVVEQGRTGRLLVYDPATGRTDQLLGGLAFANGVALSAKEDFVLVIESGRYLIRRYWLQGPRAGSDDVFFQALPGFPDNLDRGPDGLFWVALISPRSRELDGIAGSPFLRRVVFRLPEMLQPKIKPYLHIVALDEAGRVRANLQDPHTRFEANTSVFVTRDTFYFGSLHAPAMAILPRRDAANEVQHNVRSDD